MKTYDVFDILDPSVFLKDNTYFKVDIVIGISKSRNLSLFFFLRNREDPPVHLCVLLAVKINQKCAPSLVHLSDEQNQPGCFKRSRGWAVSGARRG
jgi:hypothetical protein